MHDTARCTESQCSNDNFCIQRHFPQGRAYPKRVPQSYQIIAVSDTTQIRPWTKNIAQTSKVYSISRIITQNQDTSDVLQSKTVQGVVQLQYVFYFRYASSTTFALRAIKSLRSFPLSIPFARRARSVIWRSISLPEANASRSSL